MLVKPARDSVSGWADSMNDGQSDTVRAARILVVEDDALVRDHVVALLQSLGHKTVQASNGAAALEVLSEDAGFDLLFSDVMMPGGMSGSDLATAARRIVPGLPVLLTTGFSGHEKSSWESDGPRVLAKPYRRAELEAALAATMRQR